MKAHWILRGDVVANRERLALLFELPDDFPGVLSRFEHPVRDMLSPDLMRDPEPNDLTRRYCLQVSFPEPDEEERWDAFNSFSTPIEALRGCSECLETVMMLLGTPDLDDAFVRIRVWDAEDQRMVFWEEDGGGLSWDEAVFGEGD